MSLQSTANSLALTSVPIRFASGMKRMRVSLDKEMNQVASGNSTTSKREEDLNIIVESVWLDLHGSISRNIVRQTVSSLYKEYDEAKVRNFIPIIIQRRAKALLLKGSSSGISNQQ